MERDSQIDPEDVNSTPSSPDTADSPTRTRPTRQTRSPCRSPCRPPKSTNARKRYKRRAEIRRR